MARSQSGTIRRRRRGSLVALAAVFLLLWGATAHAVPLYFTGPGGFGVSQSDAIASGLAIIAKAPYALSAGELDIVTPDPITLDTKATSTGPSDPATGATQWQITNLGLEDEEDLWLVFWSKAMVDPNYPSLPASRVGLEVSGSDWALFQTRAGGQDYYYPAVFLGDLAMGETTGALIQYRVLDDLVRVGGDYMYPRYWVGRVNAPIPEPSSLLLFAVSFAAFAASRRQRW